MCAIYEEGTVNNQTCQSFPKFHNENFWMNDVPQTSRPFEVDTHQDIS